jgi:hypothetical protein
MPYRGSSIRPLHHLVDGASRTQRTLHRRPKLPNPYDPFGLFGDGPPRGSSTQASLANVRRPAPTRR